MAMLPIGKGLWVWRMPWWKKPYLRKPWTKCKKVTIVQGNVITVVKSSDYGVSCEVQVLYLQHGG